MYPIIYLSFLTFFSSIPYSLLNYTLQNWQLDAHVSITAMTLLVMIQVPYFFAPVWGWVIDRFRQRLPERFYLMAGGGAVSVSCWGLSVVDPNSLSFWYWAFLMCLGASWFDASLGSYRTFFRKNHLAWLASSVNVSYRVGMILFQAGLVIMAQYVGWPFIYKALSVFGFFFLSLLYFGYIVIIMEPSSAAHMGLKGVGRWLRDEIGFSRFLYFFFFNASYFWIATILLGYFRVSLDIDAVTVAKTIKGLGLVVTLLMSLLAGWWLQKMQFRYLRELMMLQFVGWVLIFLVVCGQQNVMIKMYELVLIESLVHGFLGTIIVALIIQCASDDFPAVSIAMLTSIAMLAKLVIASFSGWFFEHWWSMYWLILFVLAALPIGLARSMFSFLRQQNQVV